MLLLLVLAAGDPAAFARAALEKTCAKCHCGEGADADEGGFDFLFDREALVRERFVVPGNARASRLWQRLSKAEMPPAEEWAGLPRAEQRRRRLELGRALDAWISAGAPTERFDSPKTPPAEAPLTAAATTRAMLDDLGRLSAAARSTARWFTVRPSEEVALKKALNSLSWRAKLVHPAPVVPGLVRIELDDLGWTRDDWERTLAPEYPFGFASGSFEEGTLAAATGSAQPVLRADWFIANATRPPLYHALARTPQNEAALEGLLDVRVRDDVNRAAVVRAGFASSGVSQNNRLIERHGTRFGAYWRSYDFASNVGPRNLFERPLTFVHDGGEHIWVLPNGLFGYLLTDARGDRIDRGPTTIVRDPRRPDGAVENGLSCMGCHARGFIPKTDQVAAAVRSSAGGFSARERRLVELLHPEPSAVLGMFELDTKRFLSALGELGVDVAAEEPITRVALAYEHDLDLAAAAAELGVTPGALTRVLQRGPEAMAPLKLGGAVKRDAFVDAFSLLAQRLNLGQPRHLRRRGWDAASSAQAAAAVECGLTGTLEARIESCAFAAPEQARRGVFRLVARDAQGKEVWLDERRRLLWSPVQSSAAQAAAAAQCGGEALVEGLWFLPTVEQLAGALADGLPGAGWQPLWSRDVQHGYKHGVPGLAVGASGAQEEQPQSLLPSRCVARI